MTTPVVHVPGPLASLRQRAVFAGIMEPTATPRRLVAALADAQVIREAIPSGRGVWDDLLLLAATGERLGVLFRSSASWVVEVGRSEFAVELPVFAGDVSAVVAALLIADDVLLSMCR